MADRLPTTDADALRRDLAARSPDAVRASLAEVLAAIAHPDWRVRREAALALGRLDHDAPVLDALLDAVTGDAVEARNAALEALRTLGPAAAARVLTRLSTTHGPHRRFLLEALLESPLPEGVPVLRALLDDDDPNVPPAAAEALGVTPGPAAAAALTAALSHRDPLVRLTALMAWEHRDDPMPWQAAVACVDEPACARTAVRAVSASDDPRAVDTLVGWLHHPRATVSSESLRQLAARVREGRGDVSSALRARAAALLPRLVAFAEGRRTLDRVAAIELLAVIGDARSIDALVVALVDVDPEVSTAAAAALSTWRVSDAAAWVERALSRGREARARVLPWVLRQAPPATLGALVGAMWKALADDPDHPEAMQFIARHGGPDDAARLTRWIFDTLGPGIVQLRGAWGTALIETLLLRHEDAVLPAMAEGFAANPLALVLTSVLAPSGILPEPARVAEALVSPASAMRLAAVEALCVIEPPWRDDALWSALFDDDVDVAERAVMVMAADHAADAWLRRAVSEGPVAMRAAAARWMCLRLAPDADAVRWLLARPDASVIETVLDVHGATLSAETLRALTAHPAGRAVTAALSALSLRDLASARSRAVALLAHPDASVRAGAVSVIDASQPEARAALAQAASRELDAAVRGWMELRLAGALSAGEGGELPSQELLRMFLP